MTQEPALRANSSPSSWSAIKDFFAIPNPRVVHLLVISSAATFSLGIAMAVEWSFHARHHPGYGWLAYWAALVVALPILAWAVLLLSAAFLRGGAQSPERSSMNVPPDSISSMPRHEAGDEEVKHKEICSSGYEQGCLLQNEASEMQNEGFGDQVRAHGSTTAANDSCVPSDSSCTAADVKIDLERTLSLPPIGNARDCRDIERSLSSRL